MQRALVVVDDSDAHRRLLREACQLAESADAELVLFSWLTIEQYEEYVDALASFGEAEHTTYDATSARDIVERFVRDFVDEALDESDRRDFPIEAVVAADDEVAPRILEAAARHECDHVFVVGRHRSPTGKAIFGDVAQRVILDFDGLVTIATD